MQSKRSNSRLLICRICSLQKKEVPTQNPAAAVAAAAAATAAPCQSVSPFAVREEAPTGLHSPSPQFAQLEETLHKGGGGTCIFNVNFSG